MLLNHLVSSPVILEDDVLLVSNAVVIEGVHIGKGAVVGAGSIVTQDVPSWCGCCWKSSKNHQGTKR